MSATKNKPPFLPKLRQLIDNSPTRVVRWNDEGTVVEVHDREAFEVEISKYYAGTAQTFLRQLHMYGFQKADRVDSWSFRHKNFTRDKPELQELIVRKQQTRTPRTRQPRPQGSAAGDRPARRPRLDARDDDGSTVNEYSHAQQQHHHRHNNSNNGDAMEEEEDEEEASASVMDDEAASPPAALERRVRELERELRELREEFARFRRQQDHASALLALGNTSVTGGPGNPTGYRSASTGLQRQLSATAALARTGTGSDFAPYAPGILLAQQLQPNNNNNNPMGMASVSYNVNEVLPNPSNPASLPGLSPFAHPRQLGAPAPQGAYAYPAKPPQPLLTPPTTYKSLPVFEKPVLERSISAGSLMSNQIDLIPFEDNASVATADLMRDLAMGFDNLDEEGFHTSSAPEFNATSEAVHMKEEEYAAVAPVHESGGPPCPPPGACPTFRIPDDFVLASGVTASMLKRTFEVIKQSCCPKAEHPGGKELWSLCNARPCPTVLPPIENCPVAQALLPALREAIPEASVTDLHRMRAVRQVYEIFYANAKMRNQQHQQQHPTPQQQTPAAAQQAQAVGQ